MLFAAVEYLRASISILRKIKDKFSLVIALQVMGDLQNQMDNIQLAQSIWDEAMTLAQAQKHPYIDQLDVRLQTTYIQTENTGSVS